MDHPYRFRKFLEKIRPSSEQLNEFRRSHLALRKLLRRDPTLRHHIVTSFLQGSYRRSTAVRSPDDRAGSDVDLVLVTDFDSKRHTPDKVLGLLQPFLREHYPGWRPQGRSLRIDVGDVALDLVMASAPSRVDLLQQEFGAEPLDQAQLQTPAEREAWRTEPLLIPDRDTRCWRPTHPLAQLAATRDKNARCGGHYLSVVKAIKWWKLATPGMPEHPKSYPLERLVEEYCPDDIESVADGVVRTLEAIAASHANGKKPFLRGHHVNGQDVLARITPQDFGAFVSHTAVGAKLARQAFVCEDEVRSQALWQRLFGSTFPATAIEAQEIDLQVKPAPGISLQQVMTVLAERGQLVVSGFEQIGKLKRTLEQAVQQLGIRIDWDPSTPPELRDYLGVMLLNAMSTSLLGAGVGVVASALFGHSKELVAIGAIIGGYMGAMRGHKQVQAGWRLRSWYDGDQVFVELKPSS